MGFGGGDIVNLFKDKFTELIVIEGSKDLCDRSMELFGMYPGFSCFHSYFETFELSQNDRVDVILGNHVLEHVDDPIEVLIKSKSWLKETGCAIFSVPNANSLHRRIGVELKMLNSVYELHEGDKLIGHQRVYDRYSLEHDVKSAGYKIVESGGYDLKLVSQKQMKDWPQELIRAIFKVSRECEPDICSGIYVVGKKA